MSRKQEIGFERKKGKKATEADKKGKEVYNKTKTLIVLA